jgi:hypothetical protein
MLLLNTVCIKFLPRYVSWQTCSVDWPQKPDKFSALAKPAAPVRRLQHSAVTWHQTLWFNACRGWLFPVGHEFSSHVCTTSLHNVNSLQTLQYIGYLYMLFRPVPCTLSVKLRDFIVWRHTWRKNLVNCAVFIDNSAGLRIALSSCLSRRVLRISLRESHSFLSLPADTTMASSQGTSVSSNSFSRWASHDKSLFNCHFLLYILRFLLFFSDNVMADVASKQQSTALFLSTIITRTRRYTELTKKTWQTWWETYVVPEKNQFIFSCSFFYTVKLHSLT